ncbi:hypothetical protein GIB67_020614 [Kingdonia uniflora]|uniref:Uncharacterized protein n=1 Tax=Kingdonia uniflora TaxID=39325 RepID=A0A7J7M8X4_9MAGN|nr:hypothetical protein GIB67_020614 [Kingdonia uniflora]
MGQSKLQTPIQETNGIVLCGEDNEFSFGVIPNVTAKGKGSSWVAEILNRMQEEGPVNSSDMGAPEISTVILLDREILGIYNGSVELEASIMGGQKDGKKIKVPLNSSNKLIKETRDLNFEVVVQVLRQKAKSVKHDYSEMSTLTLEFFYDSRVMDVVIHVAL